MPMIELGIGFALLSGICNGLFTTPMKLIPSWKWENIWLVFIVTSCLVAPLTLVACTVPDFPRVFSNAPSRALACALIFGFAWGFGAIFFGLSVSRLGVSLANTLVIGLSSALGSLVPLALSGQFGFGRQQVLLYSGVLAFLCGVWICGRAGRKRGVESGPAAGGANWAGYLLALGAGVLSAVFNIGYALALPIADAGKALGYSSFLSTNCIWVLMLGAGAIPNITYCAVLARRNRSAGLFLSNRPARALDAQHPDGCALGRQHFLIRRGYAAAWRSRSFHRLALESCHGAAHRQLDGLPAAGMAFGCT